MFILFYISVTWGFSLTIVVVRRLLLPINANNRRTTLFWFESSRVTAISKIVDYWPQRLDWHWLRCTVICRIRCVVLWFKLKCKVKIKLKYCEILRAQKKNHNWNTANEWTTHLHCFGAKRLTAKEILLIGNYYLVFLKKQRWNKSWTENAKTRFKLQTTKANKG